MKKLLFTAALSLLVMGVFAQKKVLKSAEKAFKKGAFEEAATLAKQAAGHDETKGNSAVYTLLGQVSLQQYIAGGFTDISQAKESLAQFNHAVELADEKTKLQILESPIFNPLDQTKQIDGGKALGLLEHHLTIESNLALKSGEEDFERAYPMLELLYQMDPTSTERAFFTGYAAENLDKSEVAMKYYKIVMDVDGEYSNKGYARKRVVEMLFEEKAFEEVLPVLRKGKDLYPDDRWYGDYEVQALLESDKLDEAITGLEQIIATGKGVKETFYTLSFLQSTNEEFVKAEGNARKAVELDPEYLDALNALGTAIFNQGAEYMTQANAENDDDAKYQSLKKQAADKFKEAMPVFEKVFARTPNDIYVLNPLSTIYDQLKMTEKRDMILDKIDALEGGE